MVLRNPWCEIHLVVVFWWFPSLLEREDQVGSLECRENADLAYNQFIAGTSYAKCLLGQAGFSFCLLLLRFLGTKLVDSGQT